MAVTRYGAGPDFAGADIVEKQPGKVLEVPPGGGPFTVNLDSEIEADQVLAQLGPVFIDGEWISATYSAPQKVGGRGLNTILTEASPETKRLMRVNLPAGTITKVRVYCDGNGSGPGDPQIRAAITDASGAVVAVSAVTTLGRNRVFQSPFVNEAATLSTEQDGSTKVVIASGIGNGATFGTAGAFGCFPGEAMVASAEVRGHVGGEQVVLNPRYGSSNNSYLVDHTGGASTLTTDWQRIFFKTTVPTTVDGAVSPSVKVLLATSGGGTYYIRNGMWHRGSVEMPFYTDRAPANWYDLELTAPLSWPGGDAYLVLHVGSDIGPAAAVHTFTTPVTTYNSVFGVDTSGWAAIDASATVTRDTSWSFYSGAGSMRIDWNAAPLGSGARHTNTATVSPGDRVIVYSRAKGTSTASTVVKQEVAIVGTGTSVQSQVTLNNTTSTPELATELLVEKSGTVQVSYTNGTANFTGSALIDVVRIMIVRRSASKLSSLRIASQVSQPNFVNLSYNPKAAVDLNGINGYTGGGTASQSVTRVTTDRAMPFGTTSCAEFSGVGSSASVGAYMMGPPSGRVPRGMKVGVAIAAKLVSGSITNFQFGLRTVDATNTQYGWINLGTATNLVAGRWYIFSGAVTTADEYSTCQPSVVMTLPAGSQAYTSRLGFASMVVNPEGATPYIDGELPDSAPSGISGNNEAVGPIGRVNWITDPSCRTTNQWGANQCAYSITPDPTSPTGSALEVIGNTGADPFVSPTALYNINAPTVPAAPGETWTLSGWFKMNQAMFDQTAPGNLGVKSGPSLWYWANGAYVAASYGAAYRPTAPDVWTRFAIPTTFPQFMNSVFVRLYNGATASPAAVTSYAGLKLERGLWPAGDYFTGDDDNAQWSAAADASQAILYSSYDIRDNFGDGTAALPSLTPANATGGDSAIQAVYA